MIAGRVVGIVSMVVLAAGTAACRKDQPRRGAAVDAAAAPGGAPEKARGAAAGSQADQDVEWMALGDEDVASRSGIALHECRAALAEGKGIRITVCDFIRQANSLPPRYRARFDSVERRKELLDEMISLAVLEQEAKRLGLDKTPEAEMHVERILADRMEARLRSELRARIRGEIEARDEVAYFEAHPDQFNRPELAGAAHIVAATEREAREIIAQLGAPGADSTLFAKLALEKSLDEETKARGGNLAFFTRPEVRSDLYRSVDPKIAETVFGMQNVGEIHPEPVRTDAGWHVIKLVGRRAAITRTIDQVRPMIRARIEEERLREAWERRLDEIRREVGVEVYPENLADVRPAPPSAEELRAAHEGRAGPGLDVQIPAPAPVSTSPSARRDR